MNKVETRGIGAAVRRKRKELGMTQSEVAERTGLTAAFLSQMERGLCFPSLASLMRISQALGTTADALLHVPEPATPAVSADSRPKWGMGDAGRYYEKLGPGFPDALFYPILLHRPPGHVAERMQHPGEVFCYLLGGALEYHLGDQVFMLQAGDTIHHDTAVPHYSIVTSETESVELWVCTYSAEKSK